MTGDKGVETNSNDDFLTQGVKHINTNLNAFFEELRWKKDSRGKNVRFLSAEEFLDVLVNSFIDTLNSETNGPVSTTSRSITTAVTTNSHVLATGIPVDVNMMWITIVSRS